MVTVLCNDEIHSSGLNRLKDLGCTIIHGYFEEEELIKKIQEAKVNVLVVRSKTQVNQKVLSASDALKLVCRGGVGIDNIDVDFSNTLGIEVCNTPGASSNAVAELVIGHIFSITRSIGTSNKIASTQDLTEFKSAKKTIGLTPEMSSLKLGIWGAGRIGRRTAELAMRLGMGVMIYSRSKKEINIKTEIGDDILDISIDTYPLDEMLENCDILSINLPLNSETEGIINQSVLKKLKPSAYLINVSRSKIVNESDLLKALNEGTLAGAALDVVGNDELSTELIKHPLTSVTPHLGAATKEAQIRISNKIAELVISKFKLQ